MDDIIETRENGEIVFRRKTTGLTYVSRCWYDADTGLYHKGWKLTPESEAIIQQRWDEKKREEEQQATRKEPHEQNNHGDA